MNLFQKSTGSVVPTSPLSKLNSTPDYLLLLSARFWFVIAVTGQWIFAYYVAALYGGSAVVGDFEKWNRVMPHGYSSGDAMGNIAIAIHLFLAVVIMVGGPLQIIPQVRDRARVFHRWNGRVYMFTAFVISASGLFMVWTRGTVGGLVGHVSISINAVLIMLFAVLAWRSAVARKFEVHRRWALRLFMVVSGVWFFRIGLMFWLLIHKKPVGFDPETFTGPFLTFLYFAQYLLPLVILEIYFFAKRARSRSGKMVMASGLLIITLAMALGIFAATMGMWLPRLTD